MDSTPSKIDFNREQQLLTLAWPNNESFQLSAEFLRVHSPSAEVRGHGVGQEVLQVGKKDVTILGLEPVGRYALKIVFDDGHDSGLFDWGYLYRLGKNQQNYWQTYLTKLEEAGASREAMFINLKSV